MEQGTNFSCFDPYKTEFQVTQVPITGAAGGKVRALPYNPKRVFLSVTAPSGFTIAVGFSPIITALTGPPFTGRQVNAGVTMEFKLCDVGVMLLNDFWVSWNGMFGPGTPPIIWIEEIKRSDNYVYTGRRNRQQDSGERVAIHSRGGGISNSWSELKADFDSSIAATRRKCHT